MRCIGFGILALACLAVTGANADPFPIVEGLVWHYEVTFPPETENSSRSFQGTLDIDGTPAHTLHFAGGSDDGLQQHWSQDPAGDTHLHGWDLPGTSMRFTPALLWIDVPLFVGKTWDTAAQSTFGPVQVHFEVVSHGPITVPAGTFDCFTIQWTQPGPVPAKLAAVGLLGRRSGVTGDAPQESYADGIGLVESTLGAARTDRLVSIDDLVAVEPVTWTGIRQLYR